METNFHAARTTTARSKFGRMKKQVWIGLVGVTPVSGSKALGNAKGAFVNALALVADESEYQHAVQRALDSLGLVAYEFEDVETFLERDGKSCVDESLRSLAQEVSTTGGVRFGTFHNYLSVE